MNLVRDSILRHNSFLFIKGVSQTLSNSARYGVSCVSSILVSSVNYSCDYVSCLNFGSFGYLFLCVWFRCRDKQRKEASRLQSVNRKLSAMNKLLMEENDRLQKQVSQLVCENGYMKQQLTTVVCNFKKGNIVSSKCLLKEKDHVSLWS